MGLFSKVSSALQSAGSVISGVAGAAGAYANYSQQSSNLDYQKWLQQQTWLREDTEIQRRVADLQAAGLSPVLAAGQGASTSSPVKTEAPQLETSYLDRVMQASQAGTQAIDQALSVATGVNTLRQQEETIAKTAAERDYIALQAIRSQHGATLDEAKIAMMPLQVQALQAATAGRLQSTQNAQQQLALMRLNEAIQRYDLGQSQLMNIRYRDTIGPWSTATGIARRVVPELADIAGGFFESLGSGSLSSNAMKFGTNLGSRLRNSISNRSGRPSSYYGPGGSRVDY